MLLSIKGQTVRNYSYLLDNGVNVKMEHCWSHVWVSQTFSPFKAGDKGDPIDVNIRVLGDLISGSSFILLNQGKEVRTGGAAPGNYDLKLIFKLSGKPGTLSFIVNNVVIKPKTKTALSVIVYDYQLNITETPGTLKGLAGYESGVVSYNGSVDTKPNPGVFSFYAKGKHDTKITPDESAGETRGKIKPGTYDVLIAIGISGQKHEVWLDNFVLKPDISYKIVINLNAGVIIYTGGNKEVKALHMYPAGASAQQTVKPAPDKAREIICHENVSLTNPCIPGLYDVLLEFGKAAKFEWRKNISIQSKTRTEVK